MAEDFTLAHRLDHEERGLARLLHQFKGKTLIEALTSATFPQIQELEDLLWSMFAHRGLSTAIGVQLDGIGRIIGEPRGGLGDTDYRALLRARALANRSDGQGDTLLQIVRLVSGSVDVDGVPNPTLALREYFPGSFKIEAGNTSLDEGVSWYTDARAAVVIRLLVLAAAAGVAAFFVWVGWPDDWALVLEDGAIVVDADSGLGNNTDPDVGGHLAAVLRG